MLASDRPAVRPSVVRPSNDRCPSVNTYCAWCNISVRSGRISMKFGTNIEWELLKRSEVTHMSKIMTRLIMLYIHTFI